MDLTSVHHYRIDWIVSFVAVARHGSFSAAAKTLYRSQPRVSSHIAALERLVGRRLVDRSVQPATLTPEGRGLLPHAEEILRRLDLMAESAEGAVCGTVRLGCYPSAAAHLYPRAVRALRAAYPRVRLVLHEGPSLELGEQLVDGGVDLAVRPLHPLVSSDRVANRVLWREPLVAVFRADHPLAACARGGARADGDPAGDQHRGERRRAQPSVRDQPRLREPRPATGDPRTHQPAADVDLPGPARARRRCHQRARHDHRRHRGRGPRAGPRRRLRERAVATWWRTGEESPAVAAVRECLDRLPGPTWPWDAPAGTVPSASRIAAFATEH